MVLNGVELGSGSVRIHRADIQQKVFRALGFDKEEARERFGFLLDAFRFGTPPHAGFAFGVDRLCMLLLGAPSLREVIAFPKTKDARCPLTGAPDYVDASQLEALKLGVSVAETGREEHARTLRREAVENAALLSMLTLSPGEEERMSQEFAAIVDFAGELAGLQREAPPRPRTAPETQSLRPDEPGESLPIEAVLMNASTVAGRLITVPKTFD